MMVGYSILSILSLCLHGLHLPIAHPLAIKGAVSSELMLADPTPPFLEFFRSTVIAAMAIVQLSNIKLLAEIAEQIGVQNPDCEVTFAAEGWYIAYIDVEIGCAGPVIEISRCWGGPSPNVEEAKDDAARVAIQKLRCGLDLQIRDANYEDYILYRSLYEHVTAQHTDLLARFNNLDREYDLLKDCYMSTVSQNVEFIDEQVRMRATIAECRSTINALHAGCAAPPPEPSEASSAS